MRRDFATDAALRPQPKRDGPDDWPTPDCLTAALVTHILPSLPTAPIWEPAAGSGLLAHAIEASDHRVFATDIAAGSDFLATTPPPHCQSIVTNPPFNQLDEFLARATDLVGSPDTIIRAAVLLLRWDAMTAACRMPLLRRASQIHVCAWRPRWIAGSRKSPRWNFCWITWRRGWSGPPTMYWIKKYT